MVTRLSTLELLQRYEFLLGIPVGVLTSFVVMWISQALLAPRLEFSRDIMVFPSSKNPRHFLYQIKVVNKSRRRLLDVSVRCRIAVFDVKAIESERWTYYNIDTTFPYSLVLGRRDRIIHLHINKSISIAKSKWLPPALVEKCSRRELRLEDIFLAHDKVYCQVTVIGHDEFTGVMKLYESKPYWIFDINRGSRWRGLDLES